MMMGQTQIREWIKTETRRVHIKTHRKSETISKPGGCGGVCLPKWWFAFEVVAVEMREGPIRALSANCLYGLPFFLRSQKTWTQYSQEMGFTLSQRDAPAFFSIWDDGNHIDGRVTMGSLSLSHACCGFVFFFLLHPQKFPLTDGNVLFQASSFSSSDERPASSFHEDMKA